MALDNKHNISVGKSHYQDSSFRQLTGKAEYIDDIPLAENALHGALILSTIPSGKIISINTIGSKENDFELQKIVVQMKDELEKIKEQLLNLL